MKLQTKQKKREQMKIEIMDKYQQESIELLDTYFKKGNTKRGEAIAILAVSFFNGFKAGQEYSYKTESKQILHRKQ